MSCAIPLFIPAMGHPVPLASFLLWSSRAADFLCLLSRCAIYPDQQEGGNVITGASLAATRQGTSCLLCSAERGPPAREEEEEDAIVHRGARSGLRRDVNQTDCRSRG